MNQEKVRHAAAATDVILEGYNRALQALQAPLVHNGAGVLVDPAMVRSNLHRAKAAIDQALDAMNSLDSWPREQDYAAPHFGAQSQKTPRPWSMHKGQPKAGMGRTERQNLASAMSATTR
jgi:hypothetical protein